MAKRHNINGWIRQNIDVRDYAYIPIKAATKDAVDLSKLMPELDQDQLGSCGPNSVAEMLYADMLIDKKKAYIPSRLYIYYWTRYLMKTVNQDSGVDNRTMLKALATYGYVDEVELPYDESKFTKKPSNSLNIEGKQYAITNYKAVTQNIAFMEATIASGKPFLYGFDVFNSMMTDDVAKTGIVPMPKTGMTPIGGHDVTICAYNRNTQLFTFKNHWKNGDGTWWGKNGYGYMPYAYAGNVKLSGDFWVINDVVK